jgi:hypothetical protein
LQIPAASGFVAKRTPQSAKKDDKFVSRCSDIFFRALNYGD